MTQEALRSRVDAPRSRGGVKPSSSWPRHRPASFVAYASKSMLADPDSVMARMQLRGGWFVALFRLAKDGGHHCR